MNYNLGLDIGICSVGWAVLSVNENGEFEKIEDMGSRIFDAAEQSDGKSLALPRREARGTRRRLRRHKHRLDRIKYLIEKNHIMTRGQIETMYQKPQFEKSVYQLRNEALERKLSREEFCRVLINLAQRRGYKSNSKSEEAKQKDNGKALSAISENQKLMEEKGYKTVGQMLFLDDKFKYDAADGTREICVRNSENDYKFTMPRALIEKEIAEIFKAQRLLGSEFAKEEMEKKYLEIFSSQRNFDEGPGGNSRYSGNKIEQMLGKCTFEPDEPRAVKASYTFEYFSLLEALNHIKIKQIQKPDRVLTDEEKKAIIDLVFSSKDISYARIRKCLNLDDKEYFNMVSYDGYVKGSGNTESEAEKKKKFKHMQSYHKIRDALPQKGDISKLTPDQLDEIARVLTLYKHDAKRKEELYKLNLSNEIIESLLGLSFAKAGHLSIKALKKIIPFLEQGMRYDQACSQAYGDFRKNSNGEKKKKLSMYDYASDIVNPVVRRSVSQTIKVVNAIIDKYGSPQLVCVETARELESNHDERGEIKKRQEYNRETNEKLKKLIEEYKTSGNITGQDIVKFKLWQEQNGICMYSGENLKLDQLFAPGYADVDHIIPYSLCFDDSYNNKVLVKASENRQKGNRIPYDYFGANSERWHNFETLVNTRIKRKKKKENLLKTEFTEEDSNNWKSRNLNDTRYASRLIYNILNNNLEFAPFTNGEKKHVRAVSGSVTAYIRKRLGIDKVREDGDLHHAVDAAVIATISESMIQKITRYSQSFERKYMMDKPEIDEETGELLNCEQLMAAPKFIEPMPNFRKQIDARLSRTPLEALKSLNLPTYNNVNEVSEVFVSRKPKRKVTGAIHDKIIRSAKKEGYTVSKVELTSLKLDKDGEILYSIGGRIYNQYSDKLLYNALKKRLQEFNGDGKAAFAEEFRKPKKDGTPGPVVRKVKVEEKITDSIIVNKGIAKNSSMIRIDVFYVDGDGYYFVPVYIKDAMAGRLPNKACVARKPISEWKEMKEEDFQFSLYPNDLIKITNEKGIKLNCTNENTKVEKEIIKKEEMLYYRRADISGALISIINHDNSYKGRIGFKTLDLIQKYETDVLGNYHIVNIPEKRVGFETMRRD